MSKMKEFLNELNEEVTDPLYKKIVEKVRKGILQNIKDITEEEGEFDDVIATAKKAKTLSQFADIARDDLAWDYESFVSFVLDSLGGKEDPNSALFDSSGWST
jgi:hypothetical protein